MALAVWALLTAQTAWACEPAEEDRQTSMAVAASPTTIGHWLRSASSEPYERVVLAVDLKSRLQPLVVQDDPDVASGFGVTGRWTLSSLQTEAGAHLIRAELSVIDLELLGEVPPVLSMTDYLRYLEVELERPVLLQTDELGKVVGLRAPDDLMALALGIQRTLATELQLPVPWSWNNGVLTLASARKRTTESLTATDASADQTTSGQPALVWSTRETDTVGEVLATYRSIEDDVVERIRNRYVRLAQGSELRSAATSEAPKVTANARFALDRFGLVKSGFGSQRITTEEREFLPAMTALVEWRVEVVERSGLTQPSADEANLLHYDARPIYGGVPVAGRAFEMDLAKVGTRRTVTEFLDELAARTPPLGAQPLTQQERARQRSEQVGLAALLRLRADAEEEAWRLVRTRPEARAVLFEALAESERQSTHERLIDMVESGVELSDVERVNILRHLSGTRRPSVALLDGLEGLASDERLGALALLGIGSIAYEGQQTNTAVARAAFKLLAERLSDADTSSPALLLTLRALGNSGHPKLPEILRAFTNSPNVSVRAAAVRALRRVNTGPAIALARESASRDSAPAVQAAARAVLRQHEEHTQGRIR